MTKEKFNIKIYDDNNEYNKVVVLVHGFGEHSGKYSDIARYLSEQGFIVATYDLRSHGKSIGDKGDLTCYFDMVDDLDEVVTYISKTCTECEIFTFGHSMGGLISLLYGVIYGVKGDVKGQILSAPESDIPVTGVKSRVFNYLSYIIPTYMIKNPMYNTDNPYFDKEYLSSITLRFAREMFIQAPKYLKENMFKYMLPCLIFHGNQDKWVTLDYSKNVIDNISSTNKKLIELDGVGHGILQSTKKDEVLEKSVKWIVDNF